MTPMISKNYGNDIIVRKLLGVPSFLLSKTIVQHGWYSTLTSTHDAGKGAKCHLVWSRRVKEDLIKCGEEGSEIFVLGSPYVLFRRYESIFQREDARGIIAFPLHSSKSYKAVGDIEKYSRELRSLPRYLGPVTVCLHYLDYESDAPVWRSLGFKVVTAGPSKNKLNFFRNFYNIISNHKYSTSPWFGSHTIYCLEMGLPFFLHGSREDIRYVKSKSHLSRKDLGYDRTFDHFKEFEQLFSEFTGQITDEQAEMVFRETGMADMDPLPSIKSYLIRSLLPNKKMFRFY